jgi:hypothetical protein
MNKKKMKDYGCSDEVSAATKETDGQLYPKFDMLPGDQEFFIKEMERAFGPEGCWGSFEQHFYRTSVQYHWLADNHPDKPSRLYYRAYLLNVDDRIGVQNHINDLKREAQDKVAELQALRRVAKLIVESR